ncbi:hypothetical protein V1523DRAFT_414767 [Lipomyces doorenjongii]
MKSSFKLDGCWISQHSTINITQKSTRIRSCQVVRLLAFVADPSPLHWEYLNGNEVYFYHSCDHQGKEIDKASCINGIYHGKFAKRSRSRLICDSPKSGMPRELSVEVSPSNYHWYDLQSMIFQLFIDLKGNEPNHEIFGEPAQGLVRLPLHSSRPEGPSWAKVCKYIATWVFDETKSSFSFEGCWMARQQKIVISSGDVTYRRIYVVRLLAFLRDPSTLHWQYLSEDKQQAMNTPFSHACNRGTKRHDGQVGYCVNGLYHGRFATRAENLSHRQCGNGARALCPGHGAPPVYCIFTHPDGTIKPCINQLDHVPRCCCEKYCFIPSALSSYPLEPIAETPRTRDDLAKMIFQLFVNLHSSDPSHDIFGEPAEGLVRLPLRSPKMQSSQKISRNVATRISNAMKTNFDVHGCWMSGSQMIQISKGKRPHSVIYRSVDICRLLAFLADPSPLHWMYLTGDSVDNRNSPFSHSCNRGQKTREGQVTFCVNGLYHGRFATITENNSHWWCRNSARCLCPGHGVPPVHCIFTHPDGTLKPCLNWPNHVPKCFCDTRCF